MMNIENIFGQNDSAEKELRIWCSMGDSRNECGKY
jgi:hypothetical protein